jgi:hypothetical protein
MIKQYSGWTAEDLLIFRCLRSTLNVDEQPSLSIESGLDWERVVGQAVDGGVAPLVYDCLREDSRVPEATRSELRSAYFRTTAENIRYLEFAGKLFSTCNDWCIDVIALRGIAFAESLYSEIALRPISDIDVLIRPVDEGRLASLLQGLGYWPVSGHPHQWTNSSVVIDVHTDLVAADRIASRNRAVQIDMDAIWESSVPVRIAGVETRMLSWVDTFLTCSLHSLKHSCDRVLWFADLAALLHTKGLVSWEMVIARARRFHMKRPVYYTSVYLREMFGFCIPDSVVAALCPQKTGLFEKRCMSRALRGERVGRFGEIFTLFMLESVIDRLIFIYETCFPSDNVIIQSYGEDGRGGIQTRLLRLLHVAVLAINVVRRGLFGPRAIERSMKV